MRKDNQIQLRISSADKERLEAIATQRHLKVSELLDEHIQGLIKGDNVMKKLFVRVIRDDGMAGTQMSIEINEKNESEIKNALLEIQRKSTVTIFESYQIESIAKALLESHTYNLNKSTYRRIDLVTDTQAVIEKELSKMDNKKYKIHPDYMHLWGREVTYDTIIAHDEIKQLARDWEKSVDELLEQLIEL